MPPTDGVADRWRRLATVAGADHRQRRATPVGTCAARRACDARVKSSGTSPEFWSGWVPQLVHLEVAENRLAGRLAIVPSRHSTTKWRVALRHTRPDLTISHNLLSEVQIIKEPPRNRLAEF